MTDPEQEFQNARNILNENIPKKLQGRIQGLNITLNQKQTLLNLLRRANQSLLKQQGHDILEVAERSRGYWGTTPTQHEVQYEYIKNKLLSLKNKEKTTASTALNNVISETQEMKNESKKLSKIREFFGDYPQMLRYKPGDNTKTNDILRKTKITYSQNSGEKATRIQAAFKGFRARKQLQDKKDLQEKVKKIKPQTINKFRKGYLELRKTENLEKSRKKANIKERVRRLRKPGEGEIEIKKLGEINNESPTDRLSKQAGKIVKEGEPKNREYEKIQNSLKQTFERQGKTLKKTNTYEGGLPKKLIKILEETEEVSSNPDLKKKLNTFLKEAQNYRKTNSNKYLIGIRALQKINKQKGKEFYNWIANNKKPIKEKLLGARQFQTEDLNILAAKIATNGGLKYNGKTITNKEEIIKKLKKEISNGNDVFLSPINVNKKNKAVVDILATAENLSLDKNLKYLKYGMTGGLYDPYRPYNMYKRRRK